MKPTPDRRSEYAALVAEQRDDGELLGPMRALTANVLALCEDVEQQLRMLMEGELPPDDPPPRRSRPPRTDRRPRPALGPRRLR